MDRKELIFILVFGLWFALSASANPSFRRGYALENGELVQRPERLDSQTILVCHPHCVIEGATPSELPFSGFGTYGDLLLLQGSPLPPNETKPQTPQLEAVKPAKPSEKPQKADLEHFQVPYPKEGTIFLLKHSARIYLFPQDRCVASCEMVLRVKGAQDQRFAFSEGERPLASIVIEGAGDAVMVFSGGGTKSETKFSWRPYSPENLGASIAENHNVEIPP